MKLLTILMLLASIFFGTVKGTSPQSFGSCNYTDFVAQAVGICEKRFYMSLANDLNADCRASYARMSNCFTKKTHQCLEGHYNQAYIELLVNMTMLVQRFMGAPQWYCFSRPLNISSLNPSLRALIPCTDQLFTEGHKCTMGFRNIFNANRKDPRLCKAFSYSRSCTQSVFNRYCNDTVPVPTENPFCTNPENVHVTTDVFQESNQSTSVTKATSKPRQPTTSGGDRNVRVLSRMLSMTVGVVNLTNAVRSLTA